jgi:hypothetical protein
LNLVFEKPTFVVDELADYEESLPAVGIVRPQQMDEAAAAALVHSWSNLLINVHQTGGRLQSVDNGQKIINLFDRAINVKKMTENLGGSVPPFEIGRSDTVS